MGQETVSGGYGFNVEPLIEFPEKKIHMRLEDTVIITESGAQNLTATVPGRPGGEEGEVPGAVLRGRDDGDPYCEGCTASD